MTITKLTNNIQPLDEVDKINEIIDELDNANVAIDNSTITKNTSDQLQTVAVKDNRSGNAIKTWTGTKAQYDAIVTKDANTLYNITDDTDVTLSLLELLYPVGSIYIGTMDACPLQALGVGTWQLVASDRVLQGAGTNSAGDTVEAGLPNITGGAQEIIFRNGSYNSRSGCLDYQVIGGFWDSNSGGSYQGDRYQLNIDASRSNSIYGNSNTVQPPAYLVNIWERTA